MLPYDPDFETTMEAADEVMDEYRDTLATLAKCADIVAFSARSAPPTDGHGSVGVRAFVFT